MVEDIDGCEAVMDDLVVWGKDQTEHDQRLKTVMDKAKSCGLKFNKDKCKFRQDQISYVGHVLSGEGLRSRENQSGSRHEPTTEHERTGDISRIHSVSGEVHANMADISASLRKLTEKDVEWKWTETEENGLATEAPVLRFYDLSLPLTFSVDSSSTGLGCALTQEGQPVACGSRALTKTQQNYAQIEIETLAVVFEREKFHQYVYGGTV